MQQSAAYRAPLPFPRVHPLSTGSVRRRVKATGDVDGVVERSTGSSKALGAGGGPPGPSVLGRVESFSGAVEGV